MDSGVLYNCLSVTDDVIINLVGLRSDMHNLPYPIVLSIYTRAIVELKKARSLFLKAYDVKNTVFDSNNIDPMYED